MPFRILRIPVMLLLGCCVLAMTPEVPVQAGVLSDVGLDRGAEAELATPAAGEAVPECNSTEDWASIRAAYEGGRHTAYRVEGGYQARNPGQQWRTRFDGRGFLVLPDAGGWTWGLELGCYGFAGHEHEVTSPSRVNAEGGRVAYVWDEVLKEWYVNDPRGLEHGFTVHRRPARDGKGDGSPLTFTLAVRGKLRPEVAADGRGIRFLGSEGEVALTYTGLIVIDAGGQELEASFERAGNRLLLSIDEGGARYPLTIDPIAQQAYLKASNPDSGDWFGNSVAVSGDTVVIGVYHEDSNATGVNGDQSDNSATSSGAAYVFVRSGTSWSQQAYLKASNTNWYDSFGIAVAVSGDMAVVGAYQEDSSAIGVNGNQNDNFGWDSGAAYLFVRSGASWDQQAYLKASNTDANDHFGWSIAVSSDTVVVGAFGEDSNATGVNGDQTDDSSRNSGAAYVFDLDAPLAACQWYRGTGVNAATDGYVITSPAVLGGNLETHTTGCAPGNVGAFLVAYSTPLTLPSGWGEILVNIADPNGELLGIPSRPGNPTIINVPVPDDPQLAGFVFYTQAVSIGGFLCLHCAHACTVGY